MSSTDDSSETLRRNRRDMVLPWILAGVFLLAHAGAFLDFPGRLWSVAIVRFAGWQYAVPGLLVVGVSFAIFFVCGPRAYVCFRKKVPVSLLVTLAVLLFAGTFAYTFGHNFFGDGGLAVKYADGSYVPKAGLAEQGIVRAIVYAGESFSWTPRVTYRVFSVVGAALFLCGALAISVRTRGRTTGAIFALAFIGTHIISTFFFGYFETYAVPAGLFAVFLSMCALGVRASRTAVPAAIVLLLLIFLHPVFAVFLPAFACMLLQSFKPSVSWIRYLGIALLAGILVHLSASVIRSGPGLSDALLPLVGHTGQVYTMFSVAHLWDLFHFCAMALAPSLVLLAGSVGSRQDSERHDGPFERLLPFALVSAVCAFMFDFKLGAMDFDIFAVLTMPIVWLSVVACSRNATGNATAHHALLLALGVSIFRFIPWLALNQSPATVAPFVRAIISFDPHQRSEGRRKSLAQRFLEHGLNRDYRAVTGQVDGRIDSSSVLTRNNYAVMLMREGKHGQALDVLRSIIADAPSFALAYANAAQVFEQRFGSYDSASIYYERAWGLDSSKPQILLSLSRSLALGGKLAEATSNLRSYLELRSSDGDSWAQLARLQLQIADTTAARGSLRTAAALPLRPESARLVCGMATEIDTAISGDNCQMILERIRSWKN